MPVAVEFRNAIWFDEPRRERVLRFLREHQLVHVVVDEPQGFRSSLPAVWEVTSPRLALVRFHGRNKEMWEKKGLSSAAERFNYLYSEAELRNLARYAKELAEKAAETHALFNNCYRDYGQRNAMEFQRLLNLNSRHRDIHPRIETVVKSSHRRSRFCSRGHVNPARMHVSHFGVSASSCQGLSCSRSAVEVLRTIVSSGETAEFDPVHVLPGRAQKRRHHALE